MPPWCRDRRGWRGKSSRHERRRTWGLRRRLTFAFAFVALAAVSLTTWLTLGAVFEAQRTLFQPTSADTAEANSGPPWWQDHDEWNWDDASFAPQREAFRRVGRTAVLAGFLSFGLAVVAAAMFTRVLTRPLQQLTEGAKRLEAGERGLSLELPSARDELRSLTEAFNNLVAGLERQEAWRRAITADIAHDLRTPLSVMRSEIEAMQDGVVPLDDAALSRLHGEVMMLARLVDDLRTLSLTEGGGLRLQLEEVKLRSLLQHMVETFAARAAQVDVALHLCPIPDDLSATIDEARIQQVLGNLLDNALRYAAPGRVELGAGAVDGGVKLWVRDFGPGLPPQALERVFERFYRGDAARTRQREDGSIGGSGLGLAIARAIVEAHRGQLEATNHLEGGAVFTLHLP